jgi:hypothetical protein
MANSVTAILDGFNYQAFWFWLYVCQLLRIKPDVTRIGFEVAEYQSFDDVAIEFCKPVTDSFGGPFTGLFYSIKYSVDYGKEITAESLVDPKLINAQSVSILQRLHDAVLKMLGANRQHIFVLAAPWGLKSGDPIRKLVEFQTGAIRLDVLFDGTGPRGEMGRLRKLWREHLRLKSDEELRPFLSRLRIEQRPDPVIVQIQELSVLLASVGLEPIQLSEPVIQYFPLTFSMIKGERKWFTAAEIRSECRKQNLLRAEAKPARDAKQLGIRSFMPLASRLGEEVQELCCIVDEFNGRAAKTEQCWSKNVPDRIKYFLEQIVKPNGHYDLHLHCFGSIAFLAGYLIEPGMGVSPGIVQRQYGKSPEIWTVDLDSVKNEAAGFKFKLETIGDGPEHAVTISLTNDTGVKVLDHCRQKLPQVGSLLVATAVDGPSFMAVRSGTHAFALAEQLKAEINRLCGGRKGTLHLFWSAPNAFAYYFGQVSRQLGPCKLYEFDSADQTYSASLDVAPQLRLQC